LKEINAIDSSVLEALQLLESASPMIEDASFALRGYKDRCDFDPERLEAVEERLDMIKKLERKYGEGIEAVLKFRDDAEEESKKIESADERLALMEKELASRQEELLKAGRTLSEKRKRAAAGIEDIMTGCLKELAFTNAKFKIDISQDRLENGEVRIGPGGMDRVEFLFSANSGEPPKPLSKIASGGELSRVMLALKSILADLDSVPVLIFDEVDAGIGGRTAERVGKKLDMISAKRQLLCITHLPQIASHGDVHLRIEKKEKAVGVRVDVKEIRGKDRQDEIARMLSGDITELSLRHAGELLERVK
jgi:DNA repair protein RecN (Recombination protein N)